MLENLTQNVEKTSAGFIFSLFSPGINFETPTIIPVASTTRMLNTVSSTHARFSVWHDFAWIYSHLFSYFIIITYS